MTDELPPAAQVLLNDDGTPNCDILIDYYTRPERPELEEGDKLYSEKNLQPIWRTTCCNTTFMAKPEEAVFCPGCGAALYDETGPKAELVDAMGHEVIDE